MKSYLGIDLGGSKIEYGILSSKGFRLLGREKTPQTQKDIIEKLVHLISSFEGESIGLGLAGLVNQEQGKVLFSPNLPFKNFNLGREIFKLSGKKILLENDVNCFVLAEYHSRRKKPAYLIGLTLGTGIGGGIISGGKLYRGKGTAGEIGHICLLAEGPECHCGGRGCLEALSSGWALEREGKKVAGRQIRVEEMAEKARKGEEKYLQIFKKMGYYLGIGLANIVNLFSPDEIVIGGSLIKCKELFWSEMLDSLDRQSFPFLNPPLKLIPKISRVKRLNGMVAKGAALLAKEKDND